MSPSPHAESSDDRRTRFTVLRDCLAELKAAMQAGHWEGIEQWASHLDTSLQHLREEAVPAGRPDADADADALREALGMIKELQTLARARQQQIRPLLNAWQTGSQADSAQP